MTENTRERKPLVWRQDMEKIHRHLNPSIDAAQVTAELKHMARKICEVADWRGLREVLQAQIMDEAWSA